MTDAARRGFKVRALGEIAIRCADIEVMAAFYRDIIGLEHLSGDYRDGIVFFKIAEGFGGHTAVLALFHHDAGRRDLHPRGTEPPATGAPLIPPPPGAQPALWRAGSGDALVRENGIDYRVQIFDLDRLARGLSRPTPKAIPSRSRTTRLC